MCFRRALFVPALMLLVVLVPVRAHPRTTPALPSNAKTTCLPLLMPGLPAVRATNPKPGSLKPAGLRVVSSPHKWTSPPLSVNALRLSMMARQTQLRLRAGPQSRSPHLGAGSLSRNLIVHLTCSHCVQVMLLTSLGPQTVPCSFASNKKALHRRCCELNL